jgi:hypothetical protein
VGYKLYKEPEDIVKIEIQNLKDMSNSGGNTNRDPKIDPNKVIQKDPVRIKESRDKPDKKPIEKRGDTKKQ